MASVEEEEKKEEEAPELAVPEPEVSSSTKYFFQNTALDISS